jgi:hypothetical protein
VRHKIYIKLFVSFSSCCISHHRRPWICPQRNISQFPHRVKIMKFTQLNAIPLASFYPSGSQTIYHDVRVVPSTALSFGNRSTVVTNHPLLLITLTYYIYLTSLQLLLRLSAYVSWSYVSSQLHGRFYVCASHYCR